MTLSSCRFFFFTCSLCFFSLPSWAQASLDLSKATIVIRTGVAPGAEQVAPMVLIEEIARRSNVPLATATAWPSRGPAVAITTGKDRRLAGRAVPRRRGNDLPETRPEGFRLSIEGETVWIVGADARGALYGVGALLRQLKLGEQSIRIPADLDLATAPAYPIRGHQLGYRPQANSYDAWTPEQFDQYIRELTFFGVNSIESIPFHDDRETPVMRVPRDVMNRRMSEICARYGLDYWAWTPADFDLTDAKARAAGLDKHEAFYRDCPTLSGVFFPGGDPGDNPPELVLPFLEDVSKRLLAIHPDARVWLSLQQFDRAQIDTVFAYLEAESPDWLGGLVAGPSAPPIPFTRERLPAKYGYRLYPDITHNKICQYPVPWWDQAYALTLGREAINPRPAHYAYIHNWFAPYSDGFISYSDGVHDDVNKTVFSALSWNPDSDLRDILVEYSRVYFDDTVAEDAADGIFALENNWRGPLAQNGAVEGTLDAWQDLETDNPGLSHNWRWQMNLVRAYYDAYTRRRLLHEAALEREANEVLLACEKRASGAVMDEARDVLSTPNPNALPLRARIVDLCEALYASIGLQTSVPLYHAIGAERGAFLDFVDYPLNNRWWLEDQFALVRGMKNEKVRCERLIQLATWETPGPGSYYDDIGNPAKSPHVLRSEFTYTRPGEEANPEPTLWWWDQGMSRQRLSFQSSMNWPLGVVYEGLDPNATYTVRTTGYAQGLLKIDDERVQPIQDGKEIGEFKTFAVPQEALKDLKIVLTWDRPTDEGHLNWRQQSRVSEVWLLRD